MPLVCLLHTSIEVTTLRRLSEIAEEAVGDCNDVAVWLGPGHVQEFVNGVPNCMVIDSRSEAVKERLIAWLSGGLIRFYYGCLLYTSAFARGTSVYLPGRVLPMLPEQLCNGVCSLRPNEDKFTMTALMEIDDAGDVYKRQRQSRTNLPACARAQSPPRRWTA